MYPNISLDTRLMVDLMSTVYHHHDKHAHHRMRTLFFALLVIGIAMLLAAALIPPSHSSSTTSGQDDAVRTISLSLVDGEEVFNRVCSTCHTIDRPAETEQEPLAPPMRMVARRYVMMTESTETATARIVEWLEGPDAEKSLMPPMAIEHHGLMPPVVLTEEERSAVATFVVSLNEAQEGQMMHGEGNGHMKHGEGEGNGHMKGSKHGTKKS